MLILFLLTACCFSCVHDRIDHPLQIHQSVLSRRRSAFQLTIVDPNQDSVLATAAASLADRTLLLDTYTLESPIPLCEATGFGIGDLVITVGRGEHAGCTSGTVAFTQICGILEGSNRPVSAYLHICNEEHANTTVYTHELTHAMGFSNAVWKMFPLQRLPDVFYARKVHGILVPETRSWGRHTRVVNLLTSPKAVQRARDRFACPTLDGVEVDGSHFAKRIYYNDNMAPVLDENTRDHSNLALDVLASSGWYEFTPYEEDVDVWGKELGCAFCMGDCLEAGSPFCFDPKIPGCAIYEHPQDIPLAMRYFTDPRIGGLAETNFCPVNIEWQPLPPLTSGGSRR